MTTKITKICDNCWKPIEKVSYKEFCSFNNYTQTPGFSTVKIDTNNNKEMTIWKRESKLVQDASQLGAANLCGECVLKIRERRNNK